MPDQVQGWLQLGLGGLLLMTLVLGHRRLWVFGWVLEESAKDLEEMRIDRDFWRDTALQSIRHTDKALDVAGKVTGGQ